MDHEMVVFGALALVVAVIAVVAALRWRRALASAARTAAAEREKRDRLAEQLRQREGALQREHELLLRVQHSRRAEREWNRELRSQLHRLHERQGPPVDPRDVRELILTAALELVEARKGLLLTSADEDGDGSLDLVVARGFEHDPEHSALVQRFAREVLERDKTIREDAPAHGGHELTPADREIENLVAIPLYIRDRFDGVVVCANRSGGFDDLDDELLLVLGDHAGAALQSGKVRRELRDAQDGAVRMLLESLAARDPLLHRQSVEAALLARSFAEWLGLDDRDRHVLTYATLLRDVGYLTLPERLLMRPGPLTLDERSVVELHPRTGFNVLRQLPALREVAFVVLHHQERHDGSGYPFHLAGEEIPLLARVVALAEAYAAMTHDRPYRSRFTPEEAREELEDEAGGQFDPQVTELFVEHVRRWTASPDGELIDAVLEALPGGLAHDRGAVLEALSTDGVDAVTLLPVHRPFREHLQASLESAGDGAAVAIIMLQVQELERINEEAGYLAGDRLLQAAARRADHAAARIGGAAFRVGGRRLAIVASCPEERVAAAVDQVQNEFAGGPSVISSLSLGRAGARADDLVASARAALKPAVG